MLTAPLTSSGAILNRQFNPIDVDRLPSPITVKWAFSEGLAYGGGILADLPQWKHNERGLDFCLSAPAACANDLLNLDRTDRSRSHATGQFAFLHDVRLIARWDTSLRGIGSQHKEVKAQYGLELSRWGPAKVTRFPFEHEHFGSDVDEEFWTFASRSKHDRFAGDWFRHVDTGPRGVWAERFDWCGPVGAIPEASTSALMLAGLALMGGVLLTRRSAP